MTVSPPYRVDPDDPRAPPLEVWRQLSPAERARIIAELPSEVNLGPPEGDAHRVPNKIAELEGLLQLADERAELEQRQREVAERRVRELEAELERLRGPRDT